MDEQTWVSPEYWKVRKKAWEISMTSVKNNSFTINWKGHDLERFHWKTMLKIMKMVILQIGQSLLKRTQGLFILVIGWLALSAMEPFVCSILHNFLPASNNWINGQHSFIKTRHVTPYQVSLPSLLTIIIWSAYYKTNVRIRPPKKANISPIDLWFCHKCQGPPQWA